MGDSRIARLDGGEKMKKEYIKSILDGVIQVVLLRLLFEFVFSIYLIEPIEMNFVIIAILVVISLMSYIFLIIINAKKSMLIKSVINFVTFIIFNLLSFVTLLIHILPSRETSDADGVLVLFFVGPYLAVIIISRIIALIITLIINKTKK